MKYILSVFILILLHSCSEKQDSAEKQIIDTSSETSPNIKLIQAISSNEINGEFVSKIFIDSVRTFKKVRRFQFSSALSGLSINDTTVMIIYNFHEGVPYKYSTDGGKLYLLNHQKDTMWVLNLMVSNTDTIAILENDKNETFQFYKERFENEILNKIIFNKKYKIIESNKNYNFSDSITFKPNGELTGINDFINYRINIDYLDAFPENDELLFLESKKQERAKWLKWEFKDKYLILYYYSNDLSLPSIDSNDGNYTRTMFVKMIPEI